MKLSISLVYDKKFNNGLLIDLDHQVAAPFTNILKAAAKNHNAELIYRNPEWGINKYSLRPVYGAQYKLKDEKSLNAMLSEIKSQWRKLKSNSKKRHLTNRLRLSFGIIK